MRRATQQLIDCLGSLTSPWINEIAPRESDLAWHQAVQAGWRPNSPDVYCPRCGTSAGPGSVTSRGCPACLDQKLPWDTFVRISDYQPPVSDWLVSLKFRQQWRWANRLGDLLAERIAASAAPPHAASSVVMPVPMPLLRRWRRGYNQASLLAQRVARQLDLPLADVIYRLRYAQPQTNMPTAADREANAAHNFALHPVDLTGWSVWVVDDVRTTGATLRACAKLLRRAGAQRIHAAVVAVASPRDQP